ncbi:MAG: transporter [Verrucomicrobiales bacterium]|nr:transporter [Verrucomicrobiales bacterium]
MSTPLVQFSGITKSYFGVEVLKNISFTLPAGSMTGLVGENGAGKSTLMNILGGNVAVDSGSILLNGKTFVPSTPQESAEHGIAFIHQELNLFPNLTIAENLFLTRFPRATGSPFIDRQTIHRRTSELLAEIGLDVSPQRLVETLSAGERQLVEIAKALSMDARLIIFDEPTTSLSIRETDRLFALISRLRERKLTMIYISHALTDVLRLCDRIVVLRDGEIAGSGRADEFTTERLVTLMVGRTMNQLFPTRSGKPTNQTLLEVSGLTQPDVLRNISFTLKRGEVLGLSGLMGAGRTELARILFGLDPCASGTVALEGKSLNRLSPRQLIQRGFAFLTENRRSEGLCMDASVADNLALTTLTEHGRTTVRWLSNESGRKAMQRIRGVVRLDPKASDNQAVRTLSGGNQQKVVLGKWLLIRPRVFILDEPTRGIDVGAKYEIYRLIYELADQGAGIFVISSEMEELMGLCDRILVMKAGELVDELPREEFDRERILRGALGGTVFQERSS